MGALSDLLQRADRAANPANPANLGPGPAGYSQESQDSQGVDPEMRVQLLILAEAEGIDAAFVHPLQADDVAACAGESHGTLRAYLRGLEREAEMDAGRLPLGWTAIVKCDGCGPVWLWEGCPARVIACPWCFRRKAGKTVPRPDEETAA